jgi:hypothetical protein
MDWIDLATKAAGLAIFGYLVKHLTNSLDAQVKAIERVSKRIDVHDRLSSHIYGEDIDSSAIANGRAYPKFRKPVREN